MFVVPAQAGTSPSAATSARWPTYLNPFALSLSKGPYEMYPFSRNHRSAPGCSGTSSGVASVSCPSCPTPV